VIGQILPSRRSFGLSLVGSRRVVEENDLVVELPEFLEPVHDQANVLGLVLVTIKA